MDPTGQSDAEGYLTARHSAEFVAMIRRWHAFVLRAIVVLAVWWFTVILLGAVAPGVYRLRLAGEFNVGLLVVLVSFAITLGAIAAYSRFATRVIDPGARRVHVTGGED